MKPRHLISLSLIVLIVGITTCNYYTQKKNAYRNKLDNKAFNVGTVSFYVDTFHNPIIDSMERAHDSINYLNGVIRIKNGKPTYP